MFGVEVWKDWMKPEEIEKREFLVSLRGYARDEVDAFKGQVARAVRALQERLNETLAELAAAQAQAAAAQSQVESLQGQLAEAQTFAPQAEVRQPEPETSPAVASDPRSDAFRQVAQETERILMAAEEVAEELHERALREAAGIVTDARLRAEKIFAEVEEAKRSAEQELDGIRESRGMIASQMEDIGRRLAETVARLRVPVELPSNRQGGRTRLQADPQRQPLERQLSERQLLERQAADRYAVERQAVERQAHDRRMEERQLAEHQALQREAEQRQAAERQALLRREAERELDRRQAAGPAARPETAERPAGREVPRPTARAKPAEAVAAAPAPTLPVPAATEPPAPAAAAEAPLPVEREPPAPPPGSSKPSVSESLAAAPPPPAAAAQVEAPPASPAPAAEQQSPDGVAAEKPSPARAPKPAAPKPSATVEAAAPATAAVPAAARPEAKPAGSPGDSSSLSELLEEIRRTREKRPSEPEAAPRVKAAPKAEPVAKAVPAPKADTAPKAEPAPKAGAKSPAPEPEPAPAAPEPMLQRRAQALGDLPVQTARRLKRLLQEDHNDLLDRLRTRRGKGTLDDNLVPLPEQFGRFQSGLSEALSKAFAEGRRAAGGSGSADPSKAVSNLLARQVVNPLRAEIAAAVKVGLEAQDTPTAIAERASDVFRVWKGVRTELLGEGMVYAAFNQGLVDGWSRNPRIQKMWVATEEDECPKDVCAKNVAAGPVALKSTFPSGHLTPPAHGGCTCTLKSV